MHFPGSNALFIMRQDVLRSVVSKQNKQSGEQCSKRVIYVRPAQEQAASYSQLHTGFSTKYKESSIVDVILLFL
jgi:hypothetical protein